MSKPSRNYLLLTGSVFVIAIQLLLAGILIFNQVPATSRMYEAVVLEWMFMISPERELLYFRAFVIMAAAGQFFALNYFRDKLNKESFTDGLMWFFWIELVLTVYLLYCAFLIAWHGQDFVLRQVLFYAAVSLAVVHKLFFREFRQYLKAVVSFLKK
jgi:uncharacterized membrane protein YsdA (DUF1294 family)